MDEDDLSLLSSSISGGSGARGRRLRSPRPSISSRSSCSPRASVSPRAGVSPRASVSPRARLSTRSPSSHRFFPCDSVLEDALDEEDEEDDEVCVRQ